MSYIPSIIGASEASKVQAEIVIISGPSGVGKTTIVEGLKSLGIPNIRVSTSWTTRQPRPDDKPGAYKYVSDVEFTQAHLRDAFAEHNDLHEHFYGTPWSELIAPGIAILDIDVDGCRQLRSYSVLQDRTTAVFIEPANLNDLRTQLRGRGMPEKKIESRMSRVQYEVNMAKKPLRIGQPKLYDHFVLSRIGDTAQLLKDFLSVVPCLRRSAQLASAK